MSENLVVKQDNVAIEKQKPTQSEIFIKEVLKQFIDSAGPIEISDYQKQIIQGYFIKIDKALTLAEKNRSKNNTLAYEWDNINFKDLALDVAYCSKIGLDMMEDNHLFPIPYKNNKTEKYDIALMCGYNGIQYIAEKYAINKPRWVTIELIYSSDTFKIIKKDFNNKVEAYQFEINNPFDRGELIGGFGYIEYDDISKNKLIFMNKAAIEKRKPKNASAEFWGGKAKVWENGKQIEVEKDGWIEEMYLKTLKREVYSSKYIPRDPAKIDESYQYIRRREFENVELETEQEITNNANKDIIDILEDKDDLQETEHVTADNTNKDIIDISENKENIPQGQQNTTVESNDNEFIEKQPKIQESEQEEFDFGDPTF